MKVLQINTTVNTGSTGRIVEDIGQVLISNGHESYIAFGRGKQKSCSNLINIGNNFDVFFHGIKSFLLDRHGFGSVKATKKLIKRIEDIKPDIICLNNLHGYYINVEILFEYLNVSKIPILWTLFDCWSFTGHCSYFDDINCEKWKNSCNNCPKSSYYPKSLFIDSSNQNYKEKRNLFCKRQDLELIVHSNWLKGLVEKSILKNSKINYFPSGIDLNVFKPRVSNLKQKYKLESVNIILGCANIWSKRKGLNDFILLSNYLTSDYKIVLIGISKKIEKEIPKNILTISRTDNVEQLAEWYSLANVFVNLTYQDNFPTTNLESLACGTPVITYNTGGSPEAVDVNTGYIVEKGDIEGIKSAIELIIKNGKTKYSQSCIERAKKLYNKDELFVEYINLFEKIINKKNQKC